MLNRYFEDHKETDPLHLTFADVLEEALAAKNKTPGGAEVAALSPFELFLHQKSSSHPVSLDRLDVGPLVGPLVDELPQAHEDDLQMREALRQLVNSLRSRKLQLS